MEPAQDVVRRAQAGDEVAFAALVREIRPLALRWAMLFTGSADDAEDVVQTSLVSVHRHLASFRLGARFTTWLHPIVRRAAADWRRAQKRRAVRERTWIDQLEREVDHDSARAEVERDLARALELMRGLSVRQREAFDLTELQGKSYDEAAALLGLSASTVRVHVLRARRAIRARMLARFANVEGR